MNNIFIGFIFLLFDFSINLGESSISLVPSCVGFWLIGKDLAALAGKSPTMAKTIPWAKAMMVVSAIIWVLNATAIGIGILGFGAGLIVALLTFYVTYNIVVGVKELEAYHQANLQAETLKKAWMMSTVVSIIGAVLSLIPLIGMIVVVAGIVLNVYFMTCLNQTKKLYEMIPPSMPEWGGEM